MTQARLPVWLLDFDGVVNVDEPGWGGGEVLASVWNATALRAFKIRWAPSLIDRIRDIHVQGLAEIRWCTTWCSDIAALEPALGLEGLGCTFAEPINGRAAAMGKLAAASQVLADRRRLVWTDDSEVPESGDTYDRLTFDGQALLIAPDHRHGLQPEDLDAIEAFLKETA